MTVTNEYVFFWGSIYSQWHPVSIKMDDRVFNCAEQYMMYRKAVLFEDWKTAREIMLTTNPYMQKALGRQVKDFLPATWAEVARTVVYQVNLTKFSQNAALKEQMLATGDRKFVEASPKDKVWGIGLSQNNPLIYDPKNWKGTNWLGEALDRVKETIRRQERELKQQTGQEHLIQRL